MNIATLIVAGLAALGMVGVSLYGAMVVPRDARIPVHRGLVSYGNWVPRDAALIIWPACGALVYLCYAALIWAAPTAGGNMTRFLFTFAVLLLLVAQIGAVRAALSRGEQVLAR